MSLGPRLEAGLVAYSVGAAVGVVSFLAESWFFGFPIRAEAAAAYSLLGGGLASVTHRMLASQLQPNAARAGTLSVVASFASLNLLYFANVRVLPAEHYLSAKSLLLDGLILALVWAPALAASRSSKLLAARLRWGRQTAALGAAVLVVGVGVLVARWPSARPDPSRDGEGPNLLLVLLDSARRDHMSLDGYARRTSPALDSLARPGRVYENAFSGSSWTVPSVEMLLQSPSGAGGHEPSTLAEVLAARGYVSACFTDNPHLGSGASLLRGFDRVERSVGRWRRFLRGTVLGEGVERLDPGSDERLTAKAIGWASRQRGPFFLYVHLMDSHTPYRFPPIDGRRRRGRKIEFPVSGMRLSVEEAEDIVARYDAGVRSADTWAGRLVEAVERLDRPFLAVISSDHGESLGESGRWFHGGSLAAELLAVPLLVVGEGVTPGRGSGPVGHASLSKTLLAAAGVSCGACPGVDLRAAEADTEVDGALPPDLAYRIVDHYMLIADRRNNARRLVDLEVDPERDVAQQHPELVAAMAVDNPGPAQTRPATEPSADELERLRGLGYVGQR